MQRLRSLVVFVLFAGKSEFQKSQPKKLSPPLRPRITSATGRQSAAKSRAPTTVEFQGRADISELG